MKTTDPGGATVRTPIPRPRGTSRPPSARRQEGGNMERNRRALFFALYILGLVFLALVVAVVVVFLLGGWR